MHACIVAHVCLTAPRAHVQVLARVAPHPVVTVAIAGAAGCAALGAITGVGFEGALKGYLTKAPLEDPMARGAGDWLMGFLGPVVISFGFHVYAQRALLVRHAAEVVAVAAIGSLVSLTATAWGARLVGLSPDMVRILNHHRTRRSAHRVFEKK